MFCNKCGASIENNTPFCPNCGQPVAQSEPQPVQQPVYQQPVYQQPAAAVESPDATGAMILAIIGLVCSCSFFGSLIGLILSAIARGKTKKITAQTNAPLTGKAKIARILSTIGLILGILGTIGVVIYAIVIVIAGAVTEGLLNIRY